MWCKKNQEILINYCTIAHATINLKGHNGIIIDDRRSLARRSLLKRRVPKKICYYHSRYLPSLSPINYSTMSKTKRTAEENSDQRRWDKRGSKEYKQRKKIDDKEHYNTNQEHDKKYYKRNQ